jgi:hypothetical protein
MVTRPESLKLPLVHCTIGIAEMGLSSHRCNNGPGELVVLRGENRVPHLVQRSPGDRANATSLGDL